jgi:DNA repair protein RadC
MHDSHPHLATITDILPHLYDMCFLRQEHFICLSLDFTDHLIMKRTVFIGTLTAIVVHPREVFAGPVTDHAAAIIIAHNHPSSLDATPSDEDMATTRQLVGVGRALRIPVRDHIIIGGLSYFSFRRNGMIVEDIEDGREWTASTTEESHA